MAQCEACGAGSSSSEVIHESNCIAPYSSDGSCFCSVSKDEPLKRIDFHGRVMMLCEACAAKEQALYTENQKSLHDYQKNYPDKLESRVSAFIKTELPLAKWQEVYVTERPNWIPENFESFEVMNEAMFTFITSMEKLEFEVKTRKRAVYDAAREVNARLSKDERDALINDPAFKPATNSEFKKISEDRALDEVIKTIGITPDAKQRKAIAGLVKFGMSAQEIKETLKIK